MRDYFSILLVFVFFPALSVSAYASEIFTEPAFDVRAIVAVQVKGRQDFCSGALVGPNEILTATHCVYDLGQQNYRTANEVQIGVGENLFAEDFVWLPVASIERQSTATIRVVDDYLYNDAVRLILPELLPVKPLTIARALNPRSSLHAWGFGEDQWGYVGLRKSRPLEEHRIEPNLIAFSSGACRGDSGGPILDDQFQVVGVVSLSEVQHCVNRGRRIAQRVWAE